MHIKRVIVKGFKSYGSQLEFEDFDPGSNVIGVLPCFGAAVFFSEMANRSSLLGVQWAKTVRGSLILLMVCYQCCVFAAYSLF